MRPYLGYFTERMIAKEHGVPTFQITRYVQWHIKKNLASVTSKLGGGKSWHVKIKHTRWMLCYIWYLWLYLPYQTRIHTVHHSTQQKDPDIRESISTQGTYMVTNWLIQNRQGVEETNTGSIHQYILQSNEEQDYKILQPIKNKSPSSISTPTIKSSPHQTCTETMTG